MKKRRILIMTICVVVVGVVLGVALSRGTSPQSTPTTVNVTRGDIVKTVLVDGNLEMPNKAYLSFGATGTVAEVLVSEGDNVTEGQMLARLDAQSLNSSVKTAELQVKIAQGQVNAADAQYEIALINWKAAIANTTTEKVLRLQVNIAEVSLETAKLNLGIAKLNLESAKSNMAKASIVAPFDGVVTDITITEGKELTATALATPAITLVGGGEMQMQGFIDEIDVAMVNIGQPANITLDALPGEQISGRVAFVSLVSTVRVGVISYAATITLDNPVAGLRDGMSATADVVVERRDDVLLIPNRAIRGTSANPKVVVLVDRQQKEREITLGLSDGINSEVLSGLEEGEEVVSPTSAQSSSGGLFM